MHHINGVSLMGDGTDAPLHNMLEKVLNEMHQKEKGSIMLIVIQ